ncbi:hypothetical protein DPMN_176899 [Dreissena polymorpha]|uniref:C1q domain-containing protein n=2 Tax=Dreissena polymorpha TaxID=45954 RepID=A0A9D4EB32_DREPO|nr:hypothetical protein DPMN_176899 [Dreissena polymorpha]
MSDPCNNRNGGWSSWGNWQSCSVTCGTGLKLRNRSCTSPSPAAYGKSCEGNTEAFAVCVNRPCISVAFLARGINIITRDYVSAFPTILFNEGNAYNPSTGHFTAPVDGLYSFTTQFCSSPNISLFFFGIEKGQSTFGNKTRLTARERGQGSFSDCSSVSTHVKLSKNEHVWVFIYNQHSYDLTEGDNYWNFFNGMLVQEISMTQ